MRLARSSYAEVSAGGALRPVARRAGTSLQLARTRGDDEHPSFGDAQRNDMQHQSLSFRWLGRSRQWPCGERAVPIFDAHTLDGATRAELAFLAAVLAPVVSERSTGKHTGAFPPRKPSGRRNAWQAATVTSGARSAPAVGESTR